MIKTRGGAGGVGGG